jgi:RsiW-degrading membrane proteinase PrsW (M82 family)
MEFGLLLILSLVSCGAVLAVLFLLANRRFESGAIFLSAFVLAGALSVLPALLFSHLFSSFFPFNSSGRWSRIVFVWTVNAPVEEVTQYFCFVLATRIFRSLREPQDGLFQGAATGLGFALVENLLYGLTGGWELLVLRIFVSLPGHLIYGALWGGYYGFEFYQGRGKLVRSWVPLLALVPAVFFHALFNTLTLVGAPLGLILTTDGLSLALGTFLFLRLRTYSPSRPLPQRVQGASGG